MSSSYQVLDMSLLLPNPCQLGEGLVGTSKISVDLIERTFNIEVPDENIGDVLEKLAQLFEKLSPPGTSQGPNVRKEPHPNEAPNDADSTGEAVENSEEKPKRKRSAGKGPTKVKPYQLIDLGLTKDQRIEIQEFFQSKDPKGQNDQVAVLAVKLKEFLGKSEYSVDEIHSAFKVVNKPTPKNLIAVFGNMKRDGRGGYSDNKLEVNSFTEDHVAFHMNVAAKEKK